MLRAVVSHPDFYYFCIRRREACGNVKNEKENKMEDIDML